VTTASSSSVSTVAGRSSTAITISGTGSPSATAPDHQRRRYFPQYIRLNTGRPGERLKKIRLYTDDGTEILYLNRSSYSNVISYLNSTAPES
jgi:hypothetical protein